MKKLIIIAWPFTRKNWFKKYFYSISKTLSEVTHFDEGKAIQHKIFSLSDEREICLIDYVSKKKYGGSDIDYGKWLLVTLCINICIFIIGLVSVGFEEGKEKLSLVMMARGSLKRVFWPWIIAGGMVVPLIVIAYAFASGSGIPGTVLLLIAVCLQALADLLLRYCLIKSGYYQGLFPVKPTDYG